MVVMHRLVVEEKRWMSENRFLHALNYTMLLPGPEAQQLATYLGWLLTTIDWASLLIAVAAFIALFRFKVSMLWTLAGAALAGLVYDLFFLG